MSTDQAAVIYELGALSLTEFETPRGKRILLDMGSDAVLIVPRTKDGKYILTVQNRIGSSEEVYEFPSGGIHPGESPEAAAARELLEETGATGNLKFIAKTEPLSGLVKFNIYIFIADIASVSEDTKNLEEHEEVSTVEFTKEELLQKIGSLETVDGYILLGLGAIVTVS